MISLSLPEACAAVLVAAISADGRFGVEESHRLDDVLSTSRLFDDAVRDGDVDVVGRALSLLSERGVADTLAACAAAIAPELRPTVFAVAADLMLADGCIDAREQAFITRLHGALGVDDATALKIVDVLRIKNRGQATVAITHHGQ